MKRKRLALFGTRSRHPCALIGCSRQPDCPEESQALPLLSAGLRYSSAVLAFQREEGSLQVDTRHLLTGSRVVVVCIAHESGNRHKGEGSGSCLQDNRAVGNSRLTPRDDEMNTSCIKRRRNAPLLSFNSSITNKRCSNESYTNRDRLGKKYFSGMRR